MFFNIKNEINIGQRARARTYLYIVYEFRYKNKKTKKNLPEGKSFVLLPN